MAALLRLVVVLMKKAEYSDFSIDYADEKTSEYLQEHGFTSYHFFYVIMTIISTVGYENLFSDFTVKFVILIIIVVAAALIIPGTGEIIML